MDELVQQGLVVLKRAGAQYAEVRAERRTQESIQVKSQEVETLSQGEDRGIGFRALVDGAWGFAATGELDAASVERTAQRAIEIARATAKVRREKVELAAEPTHRDRFESVCERDPLAVSVQEKLELLLEASRRMQKVKGVVMAKGSMSAWRVEKTFANSEGSLIHQHLTTCGAGIEAYAAGPDGFQRRSYPCAFGGDFSNSGYEFIEWLDLLGNAEKVAEEAVALLAAPTCPEGEFDLILGGSQLALQVHESVGHPTELDRVLGTELSFAGGSFLSLDKLSGYRYGSDQVTIVADATAQGGLGTFGYDDEGVPAQCVDIVRNGEFAAYLTSRETASCVGATRSGGAARASSWNRIPLIRMTNINLLPGEGRLEDLIADTEHGILMDTVKSWSIDDRRVNFQFGPEIAWEIRGGRLGKVLKNPMYTGITPQFWASCVAVAGPEAWRLWGLPNCGKGEPGQVMQVGHGVAPAKFTGVKVAGA